MTETWVVLLAAYLWGSIPSAYLVTRLLTGKDIRTLGDGNMGAKNTFESVGKWAGAVVGMADVAKGALAVGLARHFDLTEDVVLLVGACVVLGHDFPVFLGFRGGQGMATLIGVFSVLFPSEMAMALGIFALFFLFTRNWDLGWAVGFVLFVILVWLASGFSERLLYIVVSLPTIALRKLIQLWQAARITAR